MDALFFGTSTSINFVYSAQLLVYKIFNPPYQKMIRKKFPSSASMEVSWCKSDFLISTNFISKVLYILLNNSLSIGISSPSKTGIHIKELELSFGLQQSWCASSLCWNYRYSKFLVFTRSKSEEYLRMAYISQGLKLVIVFVMSSLGSLQ